MEDEVSYKATSERNQFPWADFYVLLEEIEKLFLWECRLARPPLQKSWKRKLACNEGHWLLSSILGTGPQLCDWGVGDVGPGGAVLLGFGG